MRRPPPIDSAPDPFPASGGVRRRAASLVLVAVLAQAAPVRADTGPSEGLQLEPELDVIHHVGDAFRFIGKVNPVFTPYQSNVVLGFGAYAAWLVSPIAGDILSPDIAKRRRLDVRLGVEWYPTTAPGDRGWSDLLQLEAEATIRTTIPGEILATLRNRVDARWQLDLPQSFQWRLRLRPQLEREFTLDAVSRTSLTPFANVEFIWSTSVDMWTQWRAQAGLQLGVHWFGAGQVLELNGSYYQTLQPSRSYTTAVGFVWYQYF